MPRTTDLQLIILVYHACMLKILIDQKEDGRSQADIEKRWKWILNIYYIMDGTTLVDQWLRICASSAEDMGLTPGCRTKIPHVMRHDQTQPPPPKKKNQIKNL